MTMTTKIEDRRTTRRRRRDLVPRGAVRCERCRTARPIGMKRCPNDCRILPDK
jgi:hypothetical protein